MQHEQQTAGITGCEECGLVVALPVLEPGQRACCPRCGHLLMKTIKHPQQRTLAYGIACLVMLVLSVSFPFMSFSVQGIQQEITLMHSAQMLVQFENSLLGLLLLLTVVILPACYISSVLYLYWVSAEHGKIDSDSVSHRVKSLCRLTLRIEPWLMVDVFLIGILVSLIKIAALADVGLGMSFWAFCLYTMLVVKCVAMVDRTWLWLQFAPMVPLPEVKAGDSHHSNNHISCHTCAQLNPVADGHQQRCIRCGGKLHPYHPAVNLQYAWALLLASAVFLFPANLYPMMYTVSLGKSEGSTIIGGVVLLWHHGSYPIAMVIFIASVVIPLAKIFALGWLFFAAARNIDDEDRKAIRRLKLYRMAEFIGRWSMIDIFVVALLVALVQLQNLMAIYPGPAALSFASVVILTMLAAMVFDPRVFWQNTLSGEKTDQSAESEQGANTTIIQKEPHS
ncbi:paraquat-inducible protein A [Photobacterium halotolerans]|uniref:PqiA/YebS family transporter subunit n=1 Tax=Photobacterium halotolerans TaxID=265726 RepID=A0A7X5B1F7_9GAMM|nr:paraquat-inducible protein A [Photobacterium halotolerans]NAW65303.1 PqiA/YebS family transporter subunit [Photobacterium halotolerans]NAW88819.1 PqiA/YebS family transporter subunit [Photobacterium halotolerans]